MRDKPDGKDRDGADEHGYLATGVSAVAPAHQEAGEPAACD
jgi:hypothetical protein